ncbi:hypothetical protein WN59_00860 [Salinicoccus sediminis]|uniref:Phosphoribulokinase/uridine kinase domain-containing protein n=1 Tax=Salinicoccus sediminis TaxID=1432562 RepID=A0A0M2SP00_9STAP|nr:hypothetical protein [Salinicoccus sediminis]KKK35416.1 hypothetical protein WN59_00860 [Salinicoccus sediminis]
MKKLIDGVIKHILKNRNCVIRISGHGAAGKTNLAEEIMERMEHDTFNYLNTDAYIIPGEYRKSLGAVYEYENEEYRGKVTACLPAAHELASLKRDLLMLRRGMDFLTIDADWAPEKIIHADRPFTIVDGMSTTFLEDRLFDLSIYIYTDGETELARRMERDVNDRGRSSEALISSHHQRRIQYELFMHEKRDEFDIVIDDTVGRFTVEKNSVMI